MALLWADWDGSQLTSLTNAPFGGLQYQSTTPPDALKYLFFCIEKWGRAQEITHLKIKTPPTGYPETIPSTWHEVYQSNGFQPTYSHVNHHLVVTSDAFASTISAAERRRLRKCQRAGFDYSLLPNPNPTEVYAFLYECRHRKGYPLPIDFEGFSNLLTQLPDEALVFAVKNGAKLISLTVAIRVNSRILYNFCPADDLDYRTFSPTVMLNAALYDYAQKNTIELIDLGTSLDHFGTEKSSLIRFKENLGGQRSMKVTYEKSFL